MKQKFYEAKMYRNINICILYIGWGVIHKLFRMTLSGLVDMNYDVLKFKKQFIRTNIYLFNTIIEALGKSVKFVRS